MSCVVQGVASLTTTWRVTSGACASRTLDEELNVSTNCFHLGWDKKSFTKTPLSQFIRYNARYETFKFRPGQLINFSYWMSDQHADRKKSEIILCDKQTFPSYEKFIAFAEKVGFVKSFRNWKFDFLALSG